MVESRAELGHMTMLMDLCRGMRKIEESGSHSQAVGRRRYHSPRQRVRREGQIQQWMVGRG